jgi:uncharacterized iron-regulated membrane protein
MTRNFFVWLHRWTGLAMAAFLIVVGLTGSLLAFLPELDRAIAPKLFPGPHAGAELDPAALARRAEALAPSARANTVYVGYVGTAQVGMEARAGAAPLDFSQIYLDSVTGEELGRVKHGGLPATAGAIMPFVYSLHYELAMGDIGGWILGLVALAWTLDCFVGFYLTLPTPSGRSKKTFFTRWKPAWLVKWRGSVFRVNFDLHRAGGLWLWAALLLFAWSSVFMDLNGFYARATRLFLDYEPPIWALPAPPPHEETRQPLQWEEAQVIARRLMDEEAGKHGFVIERPLAFYFLRNKGLYEYRVRSGRDIGDKAGSTSIHFDAYSGALRNVQLPTGLHAGNTFTTWLVELHMANLFGLPYRIFVCALGLVIVGLSGTGVYIWWKKRRARMGIARGTTPGYDAEPSEPQSEAPAPNACRQ